MADLLLCGGDSYHHLAIDFATVSSLEPRVEIFSSHHIFTPIESITNVCVCVCVEGEKDNQFQTNKQRKKKVSSNRIMFKEEFKLHSSRRCPRLKLAKERREGHGEFLFEIDTY